MGIILTHGVLSRPEKDIPEGVISNLLSNVARTLGNISKICISRKVADAKQNFPYFGSKGLVLSFE